MGLAEQVKGIFTRLLQILIINARYPPIHVWSVWPKDIKDQFKGYRMNIGDTIQYCQQILKDQTFNLCMESLEYHLQSQDSSLIESSLFGIKSLAEYIDMDQSCLPLIRLFDSILPRVLQHKSCKHVSITMLLVIGEYCSVLNTPQQSFHLEKTLQFVFESLQNSTLSTVALSCLYKCCESCRWSLLQPEFGWVIQSILTADSVLQVSLFTFYGFMDFYSLFKGVN